MRDNQPLGLHHIVARWCDAGNITHRKKFSEYNIGTASQRSQPDTISPRPYIV